LSGNSFFSQKNNTLVFERRLYDPNQQSDQHIDALARTIRLVFGEETVAQNRKRMPSIQRASFFEYRPEGLRD